MRQRNFNFDHLAFSTAVSKKISFGAGLVPYSKTGYNYYEINTLPDGEQIKTEYTGEGNINRFYITAAYALFNKKLSIGYQASFLFGSITHKSFTAMYNSTNNEYFGYYYPSLSDLSLSGRVHTFGLQGELPFSSNNKFIWGLTYEPASHLSGDQSSILTRKYDTLSYHVDSGYLKIPTRIGAGIGLTLGDQLTMGIDYVMQDWISATLFNRPDSFQQYYRVSFGAEYVYNKESYTSYLAKIRFRFGAHYENTYLRLNQQGINDYGISMGLAFPLRRTNTFLHVGFEIGKRGQTNHNLIEDNYKRFFISLSLYDFWFFKRKYD
jgi:hypothetical protein